MAAISPRSLWRVAVTGQGRASLVVFIATGSAGLIALARDVFVGRALGLGATLDAWTLIIVVVGFTTTSMITASGSTIVPLLRQADTKRSVDLRSGPVSVGALVNGVTVAVVLGALLWVCAPVVLQLSSRSAAVRDLALGPLRILAVTAVPALVVMGVAGAVAQARDRFAAPALGPAVPAAAVLAALALSGDRLSLLASVHGVSLVLWAVLLSVAALAWAGARPSDWRSVASTRRMLLPGMGAAWIGAVAFSLNPVIDIAVASRMGDGEVGQLGLASRLTIATASIVAAAIATPSFPRLADALHGAGRSRFVHTLVATTKAAVGSGLAVGALIASLSVPLASLLFAGSAVTGSEARSVGFLQMTYSSSAAPYILAAVALRALHVLQRPVVAMWIAIVGCVANITLDLALSELIGLHGIAVSTTLVYGLTSFTMLWYALAFANRDGTVGPGSSSGSPGDEEQALRN